MPATANIIDRDVTIVGGGFGGCYLLKLLRDRGFSTILLEAGSRLGGVWAWSCYPGARVDCELPYYGYSDPDFWSTWNWTERFPEYKQLRSYFQHVDDVWHLSRDCVLDTQVTGAVWQEDAGVWLVTTRDGQQYRSTWLMAATGTSFKPNIAKIKGLDTFKGDMHHSAAWPEEGVSMEGKRVAIIGAGSTGIQVVQEAAKVADQVVQFIRTPNFAIPMRQRQISEQEIYANKSHIQHVFKACRGTPTGLPIVGNGKKTFDVSDEERMKTWDELWKRGGFNWSQGGYSDTILSKDANREAYRYWCRKTRERISDPRKADILAPKEMPYWISTKRPSLEQDYYEMCDQANVDITNSPIEEVTATGLMTKDGKVHEVDIIALCTGYDAVTGGLRTMGIKGRDGIDLDEKWKDGVITHLGMIVNGFPNMFMIYGPQAPTSLTNGPPFLELQVEWIVDVLEKQREQKLRSVEAKKDEEEAWRKHTLDLASKTLIVDTPSWWMGANVEGKKQEMLIYAGGIPAWHKACVNALEDWKGFETVPTN